MQQFFMETKKHPAGKSSGAVMLRIIVSRSAKQSGLKSGIREHLK